MGAMVPLPDTDSYVLMQYWSNIFLHVSLKRLQHCRPRRCSVRPRARDCLRHQGPAVRAHAGHGASAGSS